MELQLKELVGKCKQLKLLYVEDDSMARNSTKVVFERFFGEVVEAVDGVEALEKFKNSDFDVIISDINMPKMDGIDLLKRVKEVCSNTPFLLISAHNETSYFTDSISNGVDYFIVKPLDEKQLSKALNIAVNKIDYRHITQKYQENLETELKHRTKELETKLYNDDVTALGSRYAFNEDIDKMGECVLYLIDIEKFHIVNNLFGQRVGNSLLRDFGLMIKEISKSIEAKVYRLSSDEFAILKEVGKSDIQESEKFLKQLFDAIKEAEFYHEDQKIKFHIRVGIAFGNELLFQNASIALDYAKSNLKNYMYYSLENDMAKENFTILQERHILQKIIDNDGTLAVYQPIVDTDKNICKYETLMRLKTQDSNELLSPAQFLSTAVNTGLYEILSEQTIKKGLDFLIRSDKMLSINFTYSDIINTQLVNYIEHFFEKYPQCASRAVFEITESEHLKSYEIAKEFIAKFKRYGVKIAIDDFGTGFSNFNYIFEIEPHYLKIDGSLIKNIQTDKRSKIMTEAIINFSKKLGIKVIAEFVKNEEVFLLLKELGVDEFQGFYFSEPKMEEML